MLLLSKDTIRKLHTSHWPKPSHMTTHGRLGTVSLFWAPMCPIKIQRSVSKARWRDGYWGPLSSLCYNLLEVSGPALFFFPQHPLPPFNKGRRFCPLIPCSFAKLGQMLTASFFGFATHTLNGGWCSALIRVNVEPLFPVQPPAKETWVFFS